LRTDRDLSQEALAREAGVSLNLVNKLERGVVTDPHYSTLSGIARAVGVPVDELMREPVPLAEAPARSGLSEAGSFHKDAETFNGLADLLRWQLARVQPEQLPSLVYEGIVVANWAAQKKRQEVDPLLDHALEEELAAAQEVEEALSAIEDALYAISDEAKRQNKAIIAGVEDELAALRRRKEAG